MIIFAALILTYTFLGGYKAVCWTDFFQGMMMLAALLLVPIVMCATGKFDPAFADAFKAGEFTANPFGSNPFNASWNDIVSGFGWGLGYFGMPHILVRFMGIKDPNQVKKSAWIASIWVVLSLGAAIAIAILGRTYLLGGSESLAAKLLPGSTQQMVFVTIVNSIFPSFFAGILLAAIIAASMSTADSQLLVASSSFTADIYKPLIRKKASDAEVLWIGRVVVVIVAVVAYFIASSKAQGAQAIMEMVENAWGGFGAAFGPVVILSLFWRRFTYKGAVAGVVCGALVDLGWLLFLKSTGVYEIVPGFIAGLIAAVVVSLATKAPGKAVEELFDKAVASTD
jgi:sodium/proline symporter